MKTQEINYPLDSIVIVNCFETLPGGRSLNVDGYDKSVIDAGTIVYKEGGKHIPLSGAKVFESAAATAQEIKVYKGSSSLKVGAEIKTGVKVESIEAFNEAYDILKFDKPIGEALSKDAGLYKTPTATAQWIGIVIGTVIKAPPCRPYGAGHGERSPHALCPERRRQKETAPDPVLYRMIQNKASYERKLVCKISRERFQRNR